MCEAIRAYGRATRRDPTDLEPAQRIARLFRARGRPFLARRNLRRALIHHPDAAVLHGTLGYAYIDDGQYPKAVASFTRAAELEPDDSPWLDDLGGALLLAERWKDAAAAAVKSLKKKQQNERAWTVYAVAHRHLGSLDDAEKGYRNAVKAARQPTRARGNLGLFRPRAARTPPRSSARRRPRLTPRSWRTRSGTRWRTRTRRCGGCRRRDPGDPQRAVGASRTTICRCASGSTRRPTYGGRGGIPVYVRELAAAVARRFPDDRLHLYGHQLRDRADVRAARGAAPSRNARLAAVPLPSRVADMLARLGFGADRLVGGRAVHLTDYAWLRPTRAPLTAMVHDVLFEESPACFRPEMRQGLRRVTRAIVRHAARIVVPSVRTKIALVERFRADPDRVDVVPLAARALVAERAAEEGLSGPDEGPTGEERPRRGPTCSPSARWSRARTSRARSMRTRARSRGASTSTSWSRGPWAGSATLVARLRSAPRVRWEERPDDARLARLLAGARALLYPSLGEGFGLPVLEGMSQGVPVVTSAGTACADVAEGGALLVDPYDVDALADALRRVVEDRALAAALVARTRARAATFSWARTAEGTRAAWARAAGTTPRDRARRHAVGRAAASRRGAGLSTAGSTAWEALRRAARGPVRPDAVPVRDHVPPRCVGHRARRRPRVRAHARLPSGALPTARPLPGDRVPLAVVRVPAHAPPRRRHGARAALSCATGRSRAGGARASTGGGSPGTSRARRRSSCRRRRRGTTSSPSIPRRRPACTWSRTGSIPRGTSARGRRRRPRPRLQVGPTA